MQNLLGTSIGFTRAQSGSSCCQVSGTSRSLSNRGHLPCRAQNMARGTYPWMDADTLCVSLEGVVVPGPQSQGGGQGGGGRPTGRERAGVRV